MAEKWTKGEWTRSPESTNINCPVAHAGTIRGRGHHLALVFADGDLSREEVEANAHLFAAAPALYEALARIVRDWDGEPEDMFEASAALAQARGEPKP